MESTSNQKIIMVAFAATAAIVWIVAGILIETLSATVGIVARVADQDLVRHGLPVALALLTFALLRLRSSSVLWADEVVTELKRVVFPSQKDTSAMTVVVVIMLMILGSALWLFDVLSSQLMQFLVK